MKKNLLPRLLWAGFLFALLAACGSSPPSEPAVSEAETLRALMDTSPKDGGLVFLGVAGIRSDAGESVELALEEAARRVAIFHHVEGTFTAWSSRGGRLLDYRAGSDSSLSYDPDYRNYRDALIFDEETDVFGSENAVFVRVRFPGGLNLDYRPSAPGLDGKPSWIENPPSAIGEYTAGVGYAGRRNAHRDTITASYENAVFAILRNLDSVSRGQSVDYRGDGFLDISFASREELKTSGRLSNFYALETWTDPADKSVWTLAIARGEGSDQQSAAR